MYEDNVGLVDETGRHISAAAHRADVCAISDIQRLCFLYAGWSNLADVLFLGVLAAQYYFSWPMHDFVHQICASLPRSVKSSIVLTVGRQIFSKHSDLRLLDNRLIAGARKGISVTKNPSERKHGWVRFRRIAEDVAATRSMCASMAVYLLRPGGASLVSILGILAKSGSCVFDGKTSYKNVRICRIMAVTAHKQFMDSLED